MKTHSDDALQRSAIAPLLQSKGPMGRVAESLGLGVVPMRPYFFGILLLFFGAGCAFHRAELVSDHRYRVFFPAIQLAKADGERIESIETKMSCGRFRGIGAIPNDWSAEVMSPVSEQTTLNASAGHGASALWSLRELDGAITVSVEDASCFDITATVGTTATVRRYTRSELILKP